MSHLSVGAKLIPIRVQHTLNRRFWRNPSDLLCPEDRYTTAVLMQDVSVWSNTGINCTYLNITSEVGTRTPSLSSVWRVLRSRVVKGCRERLRDDLLCLDIVCDVSLAHEKVSEPSRLIN